MSNPTELPGLDADNVKTWPERIWLQHGCDEVPTYADASGVFDGISWCEDNINSLDVEYVRADVARRAQPEGEAPQAERPALTVWYGSLPESNGKSNFTATLLRVGKTIMDGGEYTFEQSEYPERVRYAADCMRHLIGELADEPDILDYDANKHSGYVEPAAQHAEVSVQAADFDAWFNQTMYREDSREAMRAGFEAGAAQSQGAQAAPIQRRVADMVRTPLTAADFSPESAQAGRKLMDSWNADAKTLGAQAAMRECPDCDGTGRISSKELCARCDHSGILPARAAQLDGGQGEEGTAK